jgi:hypothetical protein
MSRRIQVSDIPAFAAAAEHRNRDKSLTLSFPCSASACPELLQFFSAKTLPNLSLMMDEECVEDGDDFLPQVFGAISKIKSIDILALCDVNWQSVAHELTKCLSTFHSMTEFDLHMQQCRAWRSIRRNATSWWLWNTILPFRVRNHCGGGG